ncbi:MAG: peptidoglycan bridge formation glycyltransferase FemA/FemB family protein [Clostridia bacterium]|nr:peptidoglycan bridge formation glycyltransferase FemA/FemB family protein [Clostridia bacterium]
MYRFEKTDVGVTDSLAVKNGIFQQTSYWASFRSFMKPHALSGYDDRGEAVLSCLMLCLPVYLTPYSVGYITRGFVCDYSNRELVSEFTAFLKEYCKKHHIVYVIFDPFCDYRIDFEDVDENNIVSFFESLGYEKNTTGVLQPRTNYRILLSPENDPEKERLKMYSNFTVHLKNDIRFSHDRGVTLEVCKGETLERGVRIFYDLLVETTEKKGFGRRNLDYYIKFANSLKDFVSIYLYKYDYAKDKAYTDEILKQAALRLKTLTDEFDGPETTEQKRGRLEPKIREVKKQISATIKRAEIAEKYKNCPYLSASFFIKMGNKAYNFYGANSEALRALKLTANYADMLDDSLDGKVSSFNMGGTLRLDTENIKDDKMYELYQYKKQYGGEFVEMPGEFFLVINRKAFNILNGKLNYFRRIIYRR